MSIQNERLYHTTEEVLKESIQNGILPDSKEFIWLLNSKLKNLSANQASFRFEPYKNTEIFSSIKYNNDQDVIYRDLLVLYKNIVTVHQLLNRQHQNFSIEKEKLEKQLDTLENRLKQYVQNSKRSGLLPYAYETFDDTTKINLEKTSHIFIDTKNNQAHLVEEQNASKRIIPSSSPEFKLYPESLDKKETLLTGQMDYVLQDKNDLIWQKQILLKKNISLTGVFSFSFSKEQLMNHIEIETISVKPMYLTARYTTDGVSWYDIPNYSKGFAVNKKVSLDFPSILVKEIEIIFQKKESDESFPEDDSYNYQYIFGMTSISFYDKEYPTEGVFYSNELELENVPKNYALDSIVLHTDEYLPTGTNILYEIARHEKEPDWQPISPLNRKHPEDPTQIRLGRLTRNRKTELYFPKDFSIRQSEAEDLASNGLPLYKLSSLQNSSNSFQIPKLSLLEGSLRLYSGEKSWSLLSYPTDNVEGYPEISDFEGVYDGTKIEYQELNASRSGEVISNKKETKTRKYLARIGFYLESSKSIEAIPATTEAITILVNGEVVFKGEDTSQRVNYVFRSGWNEIVVLINAKNIIKVNGSTVTLGFNPLEISQNIYSSSQPLNEISLFDLQYNTKLNDRTVFAKREHENGWEILTNFASPGLKFDLHYDYKEENIEENDKVLLRATFKRENGTTIPSPLIRSYRLEFS